MFSASSDTLERASLAAVTAMARTFSNDVSEVNTPMYTSYESSVNKNN